MIHTDGKPTIAMRESEPMEEKVLALEVEVEKNVLFLNRSEWFQLLQLLEAMDYMAGGIESASDLYVKLSELNTGDSILLTDGFDEAA